MIPQETIEQVAAATDIVELIGSYVPLKRAGANYMALCPFPPGKKPVVQRQPLAPELQVFRLRRRVGRCSSSSRSTRTSSSRRRVRRLAERAGIPSSRSSSAGKRRGSRRGRIAPPSAGAPRGGRRLVPPQPNENAAGAGGAGLSQDARPDRPRSPRAGRSATRRRAGTRAWVGRMAAVTARRKSSPGGLAKWRDGDERRFASPRGGAYDRFPPPVDVRHHQRTGRGHRLQRPRAGRGCEGGQVRQFSLSRRLFTKGKVLFGLHKAKRALLEAKFAIVCEGQIDLITAFEAGIQNVIAPQGTAFTNNRRGLLKRQVEEVVLCFDADAAGQQAAERSLPDPAGGQRQRPRGHDAAGEDPDSLIRTQGPDGFSPSASRRRRIFSISRSTVSRGFRPEHAARQNAVQPPYGRIGRAADG